jgi:hypothetical protein
MTKLKIKNRKSRHRRAKLGEKIVTTIFGVTVQHDPLQRVYYWFIVPDGMDNQQAFNTQQLHGPFKTEAEADENQRIVLLGEQCKITDGGMWDPAWDKPQ